MSSGIIVKMRKRLITMNEQELNKIRQAKDLIQDALSEKHPDEHPKEFCFLAAAIDELERAADGDL